MPAVTINDQDHCEARLAKRTKFYDKKVKGFFADVKPRKNGQPPSCAFFLRFTNPVTKKREYADCGSYVAGEGGFKVDQARAKAEGFTARLRHKEDLTKSIRQAKQQARPGARRGQL